MRWLMDWLHNFMAGRRGMDQLSFALLLCYLLLALLSRIFWLLYLPLGLLSLVPLAFALFRTLSRDLARRSAENEWFLLRLRKGAAWFRTQQMKFRDRKTHRYFKCPNCSNTLRVPKGKGKICITCPVCRKEFIRKT